MRKIVFALVAILMFSGLQAKEISSANTTSNVSVKADPAKKLIKFQKRKKRLEKRERRLIMKKARVDKRLARVIKKNKKLSMKTSRVNEKLVK
ncbi:MAG: hypothetical protein ACK40G_11960 [Cytophagaceae bacterium]